MSGSACTGKIKLSENEFKKKQTKKNKNKTAKTNEIMDLLS